MTRVSVRAASRRRSPSEWVEARVPLDVRAAAAAREIVAQLLAERVASSVLEQLKLAVSELVTESVRHGDVSAGGHVGIRIAWWTAAFGSKLKTQAVMGWSLSAPRMRGPGTASA
jgi:hypothetical protein